MKNLIISLILMVVSSLALTGCDRAASLAQAEKEKQQAAEDKKALRGKFEKSPGKSY
jgi:hypothetical protein